MDFENFLNLLDRLLTVADIVFRRGAGDVLAGVGRSEVQAGIQELGGELLGLHEMLDGRIILTALESGHAFIQLVAGLELVAAGRSQSQHSHTENQHEAAWVAVHPCSPKRSLRCVSVPHWARAEPRVPEGARAGPGPGGLLPGYWPASTLAVMRPTFSTPEPRMMSMARATSAN